MADIFEAVSPRFDRTRFNAACEAEPKPCGMWRGAACGNHHDAAVVIEPDEIAAAIRAAKDEAGISGDVGEYSALRHAASEIAYVLVRDVLEGEARTGSRSWAHADFQSRSTRPTSPLGGASPRTANARR